jgi:hypothetical protein
LNGVQGVGGSNPLAPTKRKQWVTVFSVTLFSSILARVRIGELEIQNILESQQGTGTFIGTAEVTVAPTERKKKLESICSEFLSIAAGYGISVDELIGELANRKGGKNEKDRSVDGA